MLMASLFSLAVLAGLIATVVYAIKFIRSRSDVHKKRLLISIIVAVIGFVGMGLFGDDEAIEESEEILNLED